ncbi:MAG: hypothetical protein AAB426_14220, partial [Myxococcota bacterium]
SSVSCLYAYTTIAPVTRTDPAGLATLEIGIGYSAAVGVGEGGEVTIGIDDDLNVGAMTTSSDVAGSVASGGAFAGITVTSADTLDGLRGNSINVGLDVSSPTWAKVGINFEVNIPVDVKWRPTALGFSINVTAGIGLPAGAYVRRGDTAARYLVGGPASPDAGVIRADQASTSLTVAGPASNPDCPLQSCQ